MNINAKSLSVVSYSTVPSLAADPAKAKKNVTNANYPVDLFLKLDKI